MIDGPSDLATHPFRPRHNERTASIYWHRATAGRANWRPSHPAHSALFFLGILFSLILLGCSTQPAAPTASTEPESPGLPLTVLIIDDPPLAAAVERQWAARADGPLRIQQVTTAELLAEKRRHIAADAVIFPSGLMGELAEQNLITPIPAATLNSPEFDRRDIFDLVRQAEIVWGERIFAVPLGSPVLTLLYRRDIFEQIGAQPPQTWEQYQQLVQRLSDPKLLTELQIEPGPAWQPAIEPLGDGWAGQMLLARAAGYARHRNYYSTLFDSRTMEPLIAGPPFVRALEQLVAVNRGLPKEILAFGPAEVRRELVAGRCAMAITWPNRVDEAAEESPGSANLPLAAAELPGSREVFRLGNRTWNPRDRSDEGRVTLLGVDGRIGAVSSASRQPQAALSLLVRLSSTEWSDQVSPFSDSTGIYRVTQIPMASSWLGPDFEITREYGELVRNIQRRPLWLTSLRIPGRWRYMTALDEAVQLAISGEKTPSDALEYASKKWMDITQELGVEPQRRAYWRSLGMEP
jgi:multiple sugar transport system substrate-binding protein